jgi:hypothetical protein
VVPAQAADLAVIVDTAVAGTTIRLADGVYALGGDSIWFHTPGVTFRSASGNAAAVVLDNNYAGGSILEIAASNVTIAELTLQRAFHHPIHVAPQSGSITGTLIHGVRVIDPGEQGIKINANGTLNADSGVVRCSLVRLTDTGRSFVRNGCYTGGIDGHRARDWRVHDNTIEGFWCGSGLSEHAIHFWTGSRDTVVERNVIRNNARGIGFGLGQGTAGRTYTDSPCPGVTNAGHFRGVIRNNFVAVNDPRVFATADGFDSGIGLEEACSVEVLHNSVFSTQAPFSSIEWRFPVTSGRIANNLVSHNLRPRDGAAPTVAGNVAGAPASLVVDLPVTGDLHLRSGATAAVDRGVLLPAGLADEDIDREPRDATPDVGADELRVTTFADVPVTHWAWAYVESLHQNGVTGGCAINPLLFCPESPVTRAQDAVFLLRAHLGAAYVPPPAVGLFADVPVSSPFASWVEDLASRGVTAGCGGTPSLFCPDQPVSRAQMAPFLLRTLEGPAYTPPAATGVFLDVPSTNGFAPWIEELARRDITAGCTASPPRYCPDSAVTRAQMAVFLVETFGLALP